MDEVGRFWMGLGLVMGGIWITYWYCTMRRPLGVL